MLTGMLEARDMDSVNNEKAYLGAMLDACCGINKADVTRSYTSYIDMVRYLYRKCELIGWRKYELGKLQAQTRILKGEGRKTFSWYEISAMGTKTGHPSHHFVDTLERVEHTWFARAAFYEKAHKYFNRSCWKRSRWSRSVLDEAARRENQFLNMKIRIQTVHWNLSELMRFWASSQRGRSLSCVIQIIDNASGSWKMRPCRSGAKITVENFSRSMQGWGEAFSLSCSGW